MFLSNASLFHKEGCKTFIRDLISSALSAVSKGLSNTGGTAQLIKDKKYIDLKRHQKRCQCFNRTRYTGNTQRKVPASESQSQDVGRTCCIGWEQKATYPTLVTPSCLRRNTKQDEYRKVFPLFYFPIFWQSKAGSLPESEAACSVRRVLHLLGHSSIKYPPSFLWLPHPRIALDSHR